MSDISQKYWLKWVNLVLKPANIEIKDLLTDFGDGITLVTFLEHLSGTKCPVKMMPPKNEIFKLQNLNAAMEMAKKMLKNLCVNGRNFISGKEIDLKLILGFVFDLVLHYQVDEIDVDGCRGQSGLLMWCQKITKGYDGVDVKNFSNSFKDGMAFMAIAHAYNGGCVSFEEEFGYFKQQQDLDPADQVELNKVRIQRALDLIHEQMHVEKILDEEFAVFPNDKANITYLSLIFKVFGQAKQTNRSNRIILNLVKKAREQVELDGELQQIIDQFYQFVATAMEEAAESKGDLPQMEKRVQQVQTESRQVINKLSQLVNQAQSVVYKLQEHRKSISMSPDVRLPQGAEQEQLNEQIQSVQKIYKDKVEQLRAWIKEENNKLTEQLNADYNTQRQLVLKSATELQQKLNEATQQIGQNLRIKELEELNDVVNEIQKAGFSEFSKEANKLKACQMLLNQQRQKSGLPKLDQHAEITEKEKQLHQQHNAVQQRIQKQINNINEIKLSQLEVQLQKAVEKCSGCCQELEKQIASKQPGATDDNTRLKVLYDELKEQNRQHAEKVQKAVQQAQSDQLEYNQQQIICGKQKTDSIKGLVEKQRSLRQKYSEVENQLSEAIKKTNETKLIELKNNLDSVIKQLQEYYTKMETYLKTQETVDERQDESKLLEIEKSFDQVMNQGLDNMQKVLAGIRSKQYTYNQQRLAMGHTEVDEIPPLVERQQFIFTRHQQVQKIIQQTIQNSQKRKLEQLEKQLKATEEQFTIVAGAVDLVVKSKKPEELVEPKAIKDLLEELHDVNTCAQENLQKLIAQYKTEQEMVNLQRSTLGQQPVDNLFAMQKRLNEVEEFYFEQERLISQKLKDACNTKLENLTQQLKGTLDTFGQTAQLHIKKFAELEPTELDEEKIMKLTEQLSQANTQAVDELKKQQSTIQMHQAALNNHRIFMILEKVETQQYIHEQTQSVTNQYVAVQEKQKAALIETQRLKLGGLEANNQRTFDQFVTVAVNAERGILSKAPQQVRDNAALRQLQEELYQLNGEAREQLQKLLAQFQTEQSTINKIRQQLIMATVDRSKELQQKLISVQQKYIDIDDKLKAAIKDTNDKKLKELIEQLEDTIKQFQQTYSKTDKLMNQCDPKGVKDEKQLKDLEFQLNLIYQQGNDQMQLQLSQATNEQLNVNQQRASMGSERIDKLREPNERIKTALKTYQVLLQKIQANVGESQKTKVAQQSSVLEQLAAKFAQTYTDVSTDMNSKAVSSTDIAKSKRLIEELKEVFRGGFESLQKQLAEFKTQQLVLNQMKVASGQGQTTDQTGALQQMLTKCQDNFKTAEKFLTEQLKKANDAKLNELTQHQQVQLKQFDDYWNKVAGFIANYDPQKTTNDEKKLQEAEGALNQISTQSQDNMQKLIAAIKSHQHSLNQHRASVGMERTDVIGHLQEKQQNLQQNCQQMLENVKQAMKQANAQKLNQLQSECESIRIQFLETNKQITEALTCFSVADINGNQDLRMLLTELQLAYKPPREDMQQMLTKFVGLQLQTNSLKASMNLLGADDSDELDRHFAEVEALYDQKDASIQEKIKATNEGELKLLQAQYDDVIAKLKLVIEQISQQISEIRVPPGPDEALEESHQQILQVSKSTTDILQKASADSNAALIALNQQLTEMGMLGITIDVDQSVIETKIKEKEDQISLARTTRAKEDLINQKAELDTLTKKFDQIFNEFQTFLTNLQFKELREPQLITLINEVVEKDTYASEKLQVVFNEIEAMYQVLLGLASRLEQTIELQSLDVIGERIPTLHAATTTKINELRAQIEEAKQKQKQESRVELNQTFNQFYKNKVPESISRREFEQLLIAADQLPDDGMLNMLYATGKKVVFEDFAGVVETMEMAKQGDEGCIQSFQQVGKSEKMTLEQMKEAGIADEDLDWIKQNLRPDMQGAYAFAEMVKLFYK